MSYILTPADRAILVAWIKDDLEHKGEARRERYLVNDDDWEELLKEAKGN
jgi:hypothetical protein